MADNKKGFILYADQKELFNMLPNDKAGELIKHIFAYVNDENPIAKDLLIDLAFTPIKQQLKRDLKKYEQKRGVKSDAGKLGNLKRWNEDLFNKVEKGVLSVEKAESIAKDRKASQTVANIADNVNVKDNVTVTVKDKDIIKKEFEYFWDAYNKKTEKNKCFKKWQTLKKYEKDKISNVLGDYVKSTPDVQYRKNPLKWLNGECWDDEIQKPVVKPKYNGIL